MGTETSQLVPADTKAVYLKSRILILLGFGRNYQKMVGLLRVPVDGRLWLQECCLESEQQSNDVQGCCGPCDQQAGSLPERR